MRNDLTVIYYTSNREKPDFESKIRQALLDTIGDLPLISVSQKPLDFGENICIGDVGVSEINCRRQFLMGCEAAKTKYVCAAEADFMYPKEYFEFVPPRDDTVYLAMRCWVLFAQRGKRRIFSPKPRGSEGATVVNREYIIERLRFILKDAPQWREKTDGDRLIPQLLGSCRHEMFWTEVGTITFKTDRQMHRRTPNLIKKRTMKIPYWGTFKDVAEKYL